MNKITYYLPTMYIHCAW